MVKKKATCKGPKCNRPVWAKGVCGAHLSQMNRGLKRLKPLNDYRPRTDANGDLKECSFAGCTRLMKASGFCTGHYKQQYDGRPLAPLIPGRGRPRKDGT